MAHDMTMQIAYKKSWRGNF